MGMRRVVFYVFLVLAAVLVFSSAGSGESAAKQAEEQIVTLNIIIPWINEELDGFLPVIKEFEAQNPTIKVEYQTLKGEDLATPLSIQFQAGNTLADVIDLPWAWYIRQQAEKGHVLPLDDLFSTSEFIDGALDEVSLNGTIYGAPGVGGITVTEYRKSFFQKMGLGSPEDLKTKEEFVDLLTKIKALPGVTAPLASGGGVGWTFTSILEAWIIAFGSSDMHRGLTKGTIAWTDPEVRAVISNFLLPLIRDGYFSEPDEYETQLKAMWEGKHAFFVGDSTDAQIVDPPTDRGVLLLPGQESVTLWNDFWFIPQYTKHPEEAKMLLKFLSTRGQEIQVANGGRIATSTSVPASLYPPADRTITELLSRISVLPDLDDTIGGTFQSLLWDQLSYLWSRPTEEVLDEILARLEVEAMAMRNQ